ncbi:MAG: xanthine dehydrogenase accessory protein XdhC [Gammaproteobacteria bacterium]|nr:xanthine dehydrogenase accessory protein XdhC [Gammaproteobacteria bacterium]
MSTWLDALLDAPDLPCVSISVAATQGSAPREVGARMLVWEQGTAGSVGGGNLEFQAIDIARQHLRGGATTGAHLHRFALGPGLGQCCGGVVVLLFETVTGAATCFATLHELLSKRRTAALISIVDGSHADSRLLVSDATCLGELVDERLFTSLVDEARDMLRTRGASQLCTLNDRNGRPVQAFVQTFYPSDLQMLVFGAGHVGKALVPLLAQLPCEISWIDTRADEFPGTASANVRRIDSSAPEYCVDDASPGSFYIVMTHSHALDQAICERILRRGDFSYCGLIGSRSKRLKFEKRLHARGISAPTLKRLVCPIGVAGINGKQPAEIAVAVAAQLLIEYGQRQVNEAQPPHPVVVRGE